MNSTSLIFLIVILLLLIITGYNYSKNFRKERSISLVTDIAVDGIFLAIIALMTFVPNLGFITVAPGISLTLLHIPVLIGASLRGWKKGALYGLAFGICSWIEALSIGAGFNLFFIYPWTAIPCRVVFGLIAGLVFDIERKFTKIYAKSIYLTLVSALLTMIHTALVFGNLYIFYHAEITALFASSDPVASGVSWTFLGVILLGMLGEMALAFFIVPPVNLALRKATPRLWVH